MLLKYCSKIRRNDACFIEIIFLLPCATKNSYGSSVEPLPLWFSLCILLVFFFIQYLCAILFLFIYATICSQLRLHKRKWNIIATASSVTYWFHGCFSLVALRVHLTNHWWISNASDIKLESLDRITLAWMAEMLSCRTKLYLLKPFP